MRDYCWVCRKAKVTCYCAHLRPFESDPRFAILVHPRELRNSVGTGRMLHLSIRNSLLIEGANFTHDAQVNALITDPTLKCALLYPGRQSLDLNACTPDEVRAFTPPGKRLMLFIVDGTWGLARGMVNRSHNLRALPQLRFTPARESVYTIRHQPEAHCLSTLESAHWIIERFAQLGVTSAPEGRMHEGLLETFKHMISQQVAYSAHNLPRRTDRLRAAYLKKMQAMV